MKKVLKNRIFIILILCIISCGIGVYAGTTYPYQASDVSYNASNGETMNVNEALNELYSETNGLKNITGKKIQLSFGLYNARYTIPTFGIDSIKINTYVYNTDNGTSSSLIIYGCQNFCQSSSNPIIYSNENINTSGVTFNLDVSKYEYLYLVSGFLGITTTIYY